MSRGVFRDMTGLRSGRLTVVRQSKAKTSGYKTFWECLCDCGKVRVVRSDALGVNAFSCGCSRIGNGLRDISGVRFGRLVVVALSADKGRVSRAARWECVCDCGNRVVSRSDALTSGATKSCGCLNVERARERQVEITKSNTKHGHSSNSKASKNGTREYHTWLGMRRRCADKSNPWYGGKGISVCDRWANDFAAFIRDVGKCPPRHTLDRIDGNGPYSPSNCRWVTWTEQRRNQDRWRERHLPSQPKPTDSANGAA